MWHFRNTFSNKIQSIIIVWFVGDSSILLLNEDAELAITEEIFHSTRRTWTNEVSVLNWYADEVSEGQQRNVEN